MLRNLGSPWQFTSDLEKFIILLYQGICYSKKFLGCLLFAECLFFPGITRTIKYGLPMRIFFFPMNFFSLQTEVLNRLWKCDTSLFHCECWHDSKDLNLLQVLHVNTALSQFPLYLNSKQYKAHETKLNLFALSMTNGCWELRASSPGFSHAVQVTVIPMHSPKEVSLTLLLLSIVGKGLS